MIVKIEFPLNYYLPMENGVSIIGSYNALADIKVTFIQKNRKYKVFEDKKKYKFKDRYTLLDVEYSPNNSLTNETDIKVIFHFAVINSLGYINHFIDSLKFNSGLFNICNLSIRDLPTSIPIEFNGDYYEYITKPKEIFDDKTDIGKAERTQIGKLLATWDAYPELHTVDSFLISAKTHFYREEFIFAIVELQTSFEAFIRNSYKYILIKNGLSESEINRLTKIPFKNVIEQQLAKSLKVDLSFDKEGPIKKWDEKLYKLRNDIVHKGRTFVTGNNVIEAFDSYYEARNYISDCMKNEGYLNKSGSIDLTQFRKFDSPTISVDYDEISKRLLYKGLLPKDKKITKK